MDWCDIDFALTIITILIFDIIKSDLRQGKVGQGKAIAKCMLYAVIPMICRCCIAVYCVEVEATTTMLRKDQMERLFQTFAVAVVVMLCHAAAIMLAPKVF